MIRALVWVRALAGTAIAVVVLAGASMGARAEPLPPRPPTAVPLPTYASHVSRHQSTVEATGRITGTVIDVTTGAPAAGIAVVVGDVSVKTDQNGNYDRNGLPAGTYLVSLDLQPIQGMSEQSMIQVDLADGATVVQHLAFRSQPAVTPTIAVATPVASTPPMPSRLPVTAAERDTAWLRSLAVLLLACGLCLMRIRARQ